MSTWERFLYLFPIVLMIMFEVLLVIMFAMAIAKEWFKTALIVGNAIVPASALLAYVTVS